MRSEEEINITLVPKEQIMEDYDAVRISCGKICVWGNTLTSVIKEFDRQLLQRNYYKEPIK